MKKRLLATFAASLSLFLSQCSELPTQKETADGSKSVKIEIKTAPGFDTIASSAYVLVSADDMKSTIQQKLTIYKDWISGVVRNIPAGYNRHFEVFVHGFDSTLLYYGDTTTAIYSGKETYVTIILRKPGGTAVINGYIEDYQSPQDTIPTPEKPFIYSYVVAPTQPPRCSELTLATNGSYYPDSLFYLWRIVHIADYDTFLIQYRSGQTYTFDDPEDGSYQVSVSAMSMTDTSNVSARSIAKCFTIIKGLLADSLTLSDTTAPVIKLNGPDTITLPLYSSYVEPGAKAYDNVDGDLTPFIKVNKYFDSTRAGFHFVNYYVADKSGNSCTALRTIIVKATSDTDTTPPVLTLRGPSLIQIAPDDTFIEPGYTAYDNKDGDITSRVKFRSVEDSTQPSRTRITYSVSDNAGNSTFATRTIIRNAKKLAAPALPSIVTSKFNDTTMSISFQTSVINPISSGTVYYDWSIFKTDTTANASVTTTKNSLTYNFENNTSYSVMVMARCLGELSYMSLVLQFSVVNGTIVYPDMKNILD